MKDAIAKRIKNLRTGHKLTQGKVAEKLFISQAAYSLIETGHNTVAVDHVIRLSKLYSKTTDFLLLGAD